MYDHLCCMFYLPTINSLSQVKRLFLLLTIKDKAMDIPADLEARRRISFFATSLFMDMPSAPTVRNMLSFRYLCAALHFLMNDVCFFKNLY